MDGTHDVLGQIGSRGFELSNPATEKSDMLCAGGGKCKGGFAADPASLEMRESTILFDSANGRDDQFLGGPLQTYPTSDDDYLSYTT